MKGKMKPAICCTVSALTLSMAASMISMAAPQSNSYTGLQECDWTYRAVADVTDEVFIRSGKSTNSKIVGYLPSAGGAYVLSQGDEWTRVRSGDVEGYIKTEYLAFGEDARKLAEVYGTPGVEMAWDGVNIFSDANGAADIVDIADRGTGYASTSNDGLWVSIEVDNSSSAYVPVEDVRETLLLETAVPAEGYTAPSAADAYSDGGSNGAEYTGDGTDVSDTGSTQDGTEYGEGSYDVYETEEYDAQTPEVEPEWGTEQTEAETWYQETEATETEWTEQSEYIPETTVPETEAPETDWSEPETTVPETEAPETSAPETNAPSGSVNSDDLTLLASIIYCEAGNQPRDGKVAVGAVVLNRVVSGSFAGTIKDVIYESGQFMPTWDGSMSSALANGVPSDCYEAAQAALNGENPVGGAMYFNTGSGKGIKIGAHQFY